MNYAKARAGPFFRRDELYESPYIPVTPDGRADLPVRLPDSRFPHWPVRHFGGTSSKSPHSPARRGEVGNIVSLGVWASGRFNCKKFQFRSSPVIFSNLWSSQRELT